MSCHVAKDERVARPTGVKWKRAMRELLLKRDGCECQHCGDCDRIEWRAQGVFGGCGDDGRYTKVHPCSILEIDHKTPLSEGGDNNPDNLWLLCRTCHRVKTSAERSSRLKKMFSDWREAQAA